ncbi:MAG TPA: TIM barrel protein [Acidothermaceae bacterium]
MIDDRVRFDINLSIMFTELPLLERAAAAADHGFDAAEFWWPFNEPVPNDAQVDAFVASLDDVGVRLVGLNLFAGNMPGGDRSVVSIPGQEKALRDSVEVLTAIAARTGCRSFNALYGQRIAGIEPERQDELAVENLGLIADTIATFGGTLLIEPLACGENGDYYPLLAAADALGLCDRVTEETGAENLRLLADVYHLTSNGDDVVDVLRYALARVGHVQLADAPGRHEPGTGSVDFGAVFAMLSQQGYTGYVGLEYRPLNASAESLNWLPRERRGRNGEGKTQ